MPPPVPLQGSASSWSPDPGTSPRIFRSSPLENHQPHPAPGAASPAFACLPPAAATAARSQADSPPSAGSPDPGSLPETLCSAQSPPQMNSRSSPAEACTKASTSPCQKAWHQMRCGMWDVRYAIQNHRPSPIASRLYSLHQSFYPQIDLAQPDL